MKKYDAIKKEQADITKRIARYKRQMDELSKEIVTDSVKGTRSDGTYGSIKIQGMPTVEFEAKRTKLQKSIKRYERLSSKLEVLVDEIEDFIETIDDSEIRMILRAKYIDGKTWRDIGRANGKTHQWAFIKVTRFFENNA